MHTCVGLAKASNTGRRERGAAMIIALMVLGLLALFVAASLTRITSEVRMTGNDYQRAQSFYAANASLELMSRDFAKIFLTKFQPQPADITAIENNPPSGIPAFAPEQFQQIVEQTGESQQHNIPDGPFQGLVAIRDPWRLTATATTLSGVETRLTRTFWNNRIPIFQFGIFYEDDMELHPGPRFAFGGRVHSNGNIFLAAQTGLYFNSRVSAHGDVVHDVARSGAPYSDWGDNVFVANAVGGWQRVTEGSVSGGPDLPPHDQPASSDPSDTTDYAYDESDMPDGSINANWQAFAARFDNNLLARQRALRLPLQLNGADPIEIIKRGRGTDDETMRLSRYANHPCIRVSLSDSRSRLPGAAGGVRLDGAADGAGAAANADGSKGYQPRKLTGEAAAPARVNGHRMYTVGGREHWIKIEIVTRDLGGNVTAVDATEDFLALGMTKRDPYLNLGDANAVFEIQRFVIPGNKITPNGASFATKYDPRDRVAYGLNPSSVTARPIFSYASGVGSYVQVADSASASVANNNAYTPDLKAGTLNQAAESALARTVGTKSFVPFPIRMFDTREGLFNEGYSGSLYSGGVLPYAGVMTLVDVNMGNLRRFLDAAWDGQFLNGLRSTMIPDNGGAGVIVYVSDRRGDFDDDGIYDMENVFTDATGTDTSRQPAEDLSGDLDPAADGNLEIDYVNEAAPINQVVPSEVAAVSYPEKRAGAPASELQTPGNVVVDRLFRRGTRLYNGQRLWGNWRKGVTVASENAVYIHGNYNATGISSVGSPTPAPNFLPQGTSTSPNAGQVPASVAADAVIILSRAWTDGDCFERPFSLANRAVDAASETTVRVAVLTGDSKSQDETVTPNQGGEPGLNGGVHNFIRFLENWDTRLNYCGSLINLFNSRNNNGAWKCCSKTYEPPERNWVFDVSFLDPNRLPPGTPFFQYVQMTGFRQATF